MNENSPGRTKCSRYLYQFFGSLPLIAVVVLYWGQTLVIEWEGHFGYGHSKDYGLPAPLMERFRFYDSDADGYIDPYEFSFLQQDLNKEGIPMKDQNYSLYQFIDEEVGSGKEVVVIKTEMEPIITSTMTKFSKGEMDYFLGSPENVLPGLISWKDVNVHSQMYGTRNFKFFLPHDNWLVGKPYYIIRERNDYTSMNRYHPPAPSIENALLHSILAQFHPNIFLITRFGPKGTVGVVRAKNKDTIDIVFRVHAEYQLNSEPDYPFWFTPAQFLGRLITSLDCQHIYYFELELPTNNQLNIDMEWIVGPGSNEVDIGYVPLMRAYSYPSVPWKPEFKELPYDDELFNISSVTWDEEIPLSVGIQEIERTMYPFKQDITLNESVSQNIRRYAQIALDAYRFPVESMVLELTAYNGSVLSQINANHLLDSGSAITDTVMGDPINRNYLNFLKKGLNLKNS